MFSKVVLESTVALIVLDIVSLEVLCPNLLVEFATVKVPFNNTLLYPFVALMLMWLLLYPVNKTNLEYKW